MRALFVVVAIAALVVAVKLGFELTGALRQMHALADTAVVDAVPAVAPAPQRAAPREPRATPPAQRPAPDDEPSATLPTFDADAAVREAGDRDSNIAELLNDPDPAVGSAVRDFITHLETPGNR
jgi:hypothetical protein